MDKQALLALWKKMREDKQEELLSATVYDAQWHKDIESVALLNRLVVAHIESFQAQG